MDYSLISKLYQAAEKPEMWAATLEYLAYKTGAQAAIITLRSAKNAEVVISDAMEHDLHTPYIAGLRREIVAEYINHYRDRDIWAQTQAQTHPHVPTLMSTVLPLDALEAAPLCQWLEPQGVNDTVVVELGHSKKYWTALNIFFWNDGANSNQILEFVNRHLADMRRAWLLSRNTAQRDILREQLSNHVLNSSDIALLVDEDHKVVAKSKSANQIVNEGYVRFTAQHKISISSNVSNLFSAPLDIPTFQSNGLIAKYRFSTKCTEKMALKTGEAIGLRVLTLRPISNDLPPWEDPRLNPREQLATRALVKNQRIGAIALELGVSDRHARTIWKNIREKLGVLSKHDLIIKFGDRI